MKPEKKTYTYHVTMDIPNSQRTHAETDVEGVSNQADAKHKATMIFFNHPFTGVHKYMKAERVND